jgi:ribose transport system ATP-binding protein
MESISLKTIEIKKRFGGVRALVDGSIEVRTGEVLALVGSNGSGKSTLAKIITGVLEHDDGQVIYWDEPVKYQNPMAAQKAGIMAVYQDLSLIPSLTVAENIWLANEPLTNGGFLNNRLMNAKTNELLKLFENTFQKSLHPEAYVNSLPPDEKQIVEILKAVSRDPEVIIFDEATASLDSNQVGCLFDLIKKLKQDNKALVFISHRMDEIFRIADRAVVLRNGRTVGEALIIETDEEKIVKMMVGTEAIFENDIAEFIEIKETEPALVLEDIESLRLNGVSFSINKGELVGIGGLRGQGQSALLHTLFGNQSFSGNISLFGKDIRFKHPKDAMKEDVALIPGDRAVEGLLLIRSILENFHLPSWNKYSHPLLNLKKATKDANRVSEQLNLVMESLESPVINLSGGNAQKVVIGKWLLRKPRLLLLDDPTKGVDVGTKTEFYQLLKRLTIEGATILFHSSDDQELLDLCPRVLVMQDGRIKADLSGDRLTEANLVSASMGADSTNEEREEHQHA